MHNRIHDALLRESCKVVQVVDLPSTLPEYATRVYGFDAMVAFMKEYHQDLKNFTVCEPTDTDINNAMYVVFNTNDLT
jgi:hypothetical protein